MKRPTGKLPPEVKEGQCWGTYLVTDLYWVGNRGVNGYKACELPYGHLCPCGPQHVFDKDVAYLGERALHVVAT